MRESYLEYEILNQTAVIKINRESVYNALNSEAKAQIVEKVEQSNVQQGIRSIIITGNGKAFCTGQDLNDRNMTNDSREIDLGHTLETEWNPLMKVIRESKVPVIAAVNGVAAGAGLSLALSCDLIVAKPGVKFISGFSKLGLCPDAGSSYILTRAIGYQRALNFFLTNEPLTSEELKDAGIVNILDESAYDKAYELSLKINGLAPLSVQNIKYNIQRAYEKSYKETIELETTAQRFLGKSQDYQEGVKAFFEKRDPQFTGR